MTVDEQRIVQAALIAHEVELAFSGDYAEAERARELRLQLTPDLPR